MRFYRSEIERDKRAGLDKGIVLSWFLPKDIELPPKQELSYKEVAF
jgi:hypothetical protein